jgi:hypothetical protein
MSKKSRKTYKKPQINQVKLVVDEAVLQNCKIKSGDPGKDTKHCNFAACSVPGS